MSWKKDEDGDFVFQIRTEDKLLGEFIRALIEKAPTDEQVLTLLAHYSLMIDEDIN
jgi:hypothetical protein